MNSDLQNRGLQAGLVIDRDTASRLGLTAKAIDNALYDAFGQRQVSTMYKGMNQYHVVMEVDPKFQQSPDALKNLYVRSNTGAGRPAQRLHALRALDHLAGRRTTRASFRPSPSPSIWPRRSSGRRGRRGAETCERTIGLPATFTGLSGHGAGLSGLAGHRALPDPGGAGHGLHRARHSLRELHPSHHHPLHAAFGGRRRAAGAAVFHTELSIIALIGIILLIGIVKKNAILMIDFALEAERNEGNSPEDSIYQACLLRFRPIMMTTMAAMFGGIPIAVGTGNGSELRRPLGIAIGGGLMVSQMLTLYTTPVVYLYLDRFRAWVSGGKKLHRIETLPSVAPIDSD